MSYVSSLRFSCHRHSNLRTTCVAHGLIQLLHTDLTEGMYATGIGLVGPSVLTISADRG